MASPYPKATVAGRVYASVRPGFQDFFLSPHTVWSLTAITEALTGNFHQHTQTHPGYVGPQPLGSAFSALLFALIISELFYFMCKASLIPPWRQNPICPQRQM